MIDLQIALLESLEEQQAFNKESAVLFGMIKDNSEDTITVPVLTSCRNCKLINYVKHGDLTYYFLNEKGIKLLADSALNKEEKCTEEPQCPSSAGGDINPDMDDSMLNDEAMKEQPEYEQAIESKQHTDAFINAINEDKNPIEIIEFIVIDENGHVVQDGFETITDAIHKAHELAAVGG
jgi:hypothetical protein